MLPSKSCVLLCNRMQFQPLETGNSFANITGGQGKKSKEGGLMVSLKGGNNFYQPLAAWSGKGLNGGGGEGDDN